MILIFDIQDSKIFEMIDSFSQHFVSLPRLPLLKNDR